MIHCFVNWFAGRGFFRVFMNKNLLFVTVCPAGLAFFLFQCYYCNIFYKHFIEALAWGICCQDEVRKGLV